MRKREAAIRRSHRLPGLAAAVLAGLWLLCCGCEKQTADTGPRPPAAPASDDGTIVAVGDSLTEGLGVHEGQAYPAQLERRLRQAGYAFRVINAGISGETSAGVLSRIEWVLTLAPDIVILETGANDGLRGIDPALTRDNVDTVVGRLKQAGVTVVLAGMKMVGNLGQAFTAAFAEIYPAVAREHDVIFMPFFLEGVAADPALNQADGIHPTGDGYRVVVDNLMPYVVEAIDVRAGQKKGADRP